jgi:hypothetical protein
MYGPVSEPDPARFQFSRDLKIANRLHFRLLKPRRPADLGSNLQRPRSLEEIGIPFRLYAGPDATMVRVPSYTLCVAGPFSDCNFNHIQSFSRQSMRMFQQASSLCALSIRFNPLNYAADPSLSTSAVSLLALRISWRVKPCCNNGSELFAAWRR